MFVAVCWRGESSGQGDEFEPQQIGKVNEGPKSNTSTTAKMQASATLPRQDPCICEPAMAMASMANETVFTELHAGARVSLRSFSSASHKSGVARTCLIHGARSSGLQLIQLMLEGFRCQLIGSLGSASLENISAEQIPAQRLTSTSIGRSQDVIAIIVLPKASRLQQFRQPRKRAD